MNISALDSAKKRITATLEEIERLKQAEFPYDHSRACLEQLEAIFTDAQRALNKADLNDDLAKRLSACTIALEELFEYLPFLGFILRSTNVRNTFEVYSPLLRLIRAILGVNTKLILSSEWEYSPHTYSSIDSLPDFVMIGLPAPESTNPLLIPLYGHEIGHPVWQSIDVEKKERLKKLSADRIFSEITENRWEDYKKLYPDYKEEDYRQGNLFETPFSTIYKWAVWQAEEIFCDFFGMRLFAESYLYAFAYLLSPGFSDRSVKYPNMASRVSYLVEVAKEMCIEVPDGFIDCFKRENEPGNQTGLLVSTADAVSKSLIPDIIDLVKHFATEKTIPIRDPDAVSKITTSFNMTVPTPQFQSLTDILNAGWHCYLDPNLWTTIPQMKEKDQILKDIVLKSIEVSEAYKRMGEKT